MARTGLAVLAVAAYLGAATAIQYFMVQLKHPEAVWLWCDMAKLCGGANG